MNDGTLYAKAWNDLRRRRRRFFLLWLGWVPGGATVTVLFTLLVRGLRLLGLPVPDGVIVAFAFALFIVSGLLLEGICTAGS